MYISLDGSDTTGDGTSLYPFRTLVAAAPYLAGSGKIIAKAGDYVDEVFPLTIGSTIIAGENRETTRFLYGDRITSADLEDGYTKVYKKTAVNIPTSAYEVWQHDIQAATTEIIPAEVHALQRGLTHRLSSYRMLRVGSIAEVEASAVPCFYMDGTETIYFQKSVGSDLAVNPVVVPVWTYAIADKVLSFENFTMLYRPMNIMGGSVISLEDVSVKFNNYSCIYANGTSHVTSVGVECAGSHNDGCGYGDDAVASETDCWMHSNLDEGSSCHERSHIVRTGGLYEHNGSAGFVDVGSSITEASGVLSRQNAGGNTQMVFTYYPAVVDNGNAELINCTGTVTGAVTGGGAPGIRVRCYNCPDAVASDTVEVNP